jgi:predicted transcriptional regulator
MDFFSRKGFHNNLLIGFPISRPSGIQFGEPVVAIGKRQYRSRIQIAADILEIAKNGSRKTRIMYLGNLSFDLLQKYLNLLVNYELLEIIGRSDRSYVATSKGKQFLEDYRELQRYSQMVDSKKRALEASMALKV